MSSILSRGRWVKNTAVNHPINMAESRANNQNGHALLRDRFFCDITYKPIEAETRWLPFRTRHFQMHFNENVSIPIKISLKFVPKGPINNIPALVQIMAWRRPGDKPLSEPMMVSLLTHICVNQHQWVNIAKLFSATQQVRSCSGPIHSHSFGPRGLVELTWCVGKIPQICE